MRTRLFAVLLGAAVLAAVVSAQQSSLVTLDAVAKAMGATPLKTIEYSGAGYAFAFQQAPGPGEPWPLFVVDTYKVSVDYSAPAMRQEMTRSQGEHPPRGGAGQPMADTTRTVQLVNGRFAWSENGTRIQANSGAVSDRLRQLWMTPHGLIKAAIANKASIRGRTMSFTVEGRALKVTVNAENLIERAEYLVDSSVIGDVPMELVYTDYVDRDGVKFPTHIIEKTDGYLSLDITVSEAKVNTPMSVSVPSNLTSAPAAAPATTAPKVQARQIGPGVWHLVASNYGSVLVEFKDFLLMFEGPIDDARSIAANQWARATVAGKPIKYVVNTHAHFDHAGGIREYVAEGITIITHEMNRSYYEMVWARPRTVHPDALSLKPRTPIWETMTEKKVVTDGARTLELYKLQGNGHNPYILIGYLPTEKILLYGDMYNPPPGNDPRDLARTNEYADNLYDNVVNRFKLDVKLLAPIHGLPVPFDNLKKAIGLMPLTQ